MVREAVTNSVEPGEIAGAVGGELSERQEAAITHRVGPGVAHRHAGIAVLQEAVAHQLGPEPADTQEDLVVDGEELSLNLAEGRVVQHAGAVLWLGIDIGQDVVLAKRDGGPPPEVEDGQVGIEVAGAVEFAFARPSY